MKIKHTILVGEPMGLFIADELGKLEDVNHFSFTTCGAELNVAIGMKRLGHDVSYMTKLGNDPFGARIVNRIKELGISTDLIQFSPEHPTGFMFKSMVTDGDPSIFYFRKGSAASTLSAEDVAALDFSSYSAVHVTAALCQAAACPHALGPVRRVQLSLALPLWERVDYEPLELPPSFDLGPTGGRYRRGQHGHRQAQRLFSRHKPSH